MKKFFFILISIIGLINIISTYVKLERKNKLISEGGTVISTVTDIYKSSTSTGNFYFLRLNYKINNKKYSSNVGFDKSQNNNIKVGSKLQLYYNQNNHKDIILTINKGTNFVKDYMVSIIMLLFVFIPIFNLDKKFELNGGNDSV